MFGLITDIDSALMSKSGKDRLNVVNMVLVRCWDYIESFCEECKKRQEEAEASGGSTSLAETLSEVLGAIAGGSEMGEGNSTPVPEASGETEESATADKRAQTHAAVSYTHLVILLLYTYQTKPRFMSMRAAI